MRLINRIFARLSSAPGRAAAPRLRLEGLEGREVPAVAFQFDYSHDTGHLFDTAQARATLERAAADLGQTLSNSLAAITPGGGNTWTAKFEDPATGALASVPNLVVPANTLVIYAGSRDLPDPQLGVGGFGGYDATGSPSWLSTVQTRGRSGFTTWGGSITFDTVEPWHLGTYSQGLTSTEFDFYSVAVHELGHVLGIGLAPQWANDVQGDSTYDGFNATAVYGGPVPVSTDKQHWQDGLTVGGVPVSLDPTTPSGQRIGFSALDSAVLADFGWGAPVAAVPTPTAPRAVVTAAQGHGRTFALTSQGMLDVYTDGVGWASSYIPAQKFVLGTDASGNDTVAVVMPNGQIAVWSPVTNAFNLTSTTPAASSEIVQLNGKTWFVTPAGVLDYYTPSTGVVSSGIGATQFSVGTDNVARTTVAIVQPSGYLALWTPTPGIFVSTSVAPTPGYSLKQGHGMTFFVSSGGVLYFYTYATGVTTSSGIGVSSTQPFSLGTNPSGNDTIALVQPNGVLAVWTQAGGGTFTNTGVSPAAGSTVRYNNGRTYYISSSGLLQYYSTSTGAVNSAIGAVTFTLGTDASGADKVAIVGASGHLAVWTPAGYYADLN